MVTYRTQSLVHRLLCLLTVTCVLVGDAEADSWAMPSTRKYDSENEQFYAKITPGGRDRPATMSVYKSGGSVEDDPIWTVTLSNRVAPVSAFVSDDGQHVVTFDNWHRVGYGDDVLAFYGPKGQTKKYSLESALDLNNAGQLRLYSKFAHTVSSRWWRSGSLRFLDTENDELAMWIDWLGRWYVWDLADGEPVVLTDKTIARWNQRGRAWAKEQFEDDSESGGYVIRACRFLAFLKQAGDRPLLVEAMNNPRLDVNSSPSLRQAADRALAIFDGEFKDRPLTEIDRTDGKEPYLLGSAKIKIGLPFPLARQKNHNAKVWIFPASVEPESWTGAQPERYLSEALEDFEEQSRKEPKSDEIDTIQMEVHSILPGKYWAKVVLDRPGFLPYNAFSRSMRAKKEDYQNGMLPMKYVEGDYQSFASAVFEVTARETTQVKVNCDQAITTGDPKFNAERMHWSIVGQRGTER